MKFTLYPNQICPMSHKCIYGDKNSINSCQGVLPNRPTIFKCEAFVYKKNGMVESTNPRNQYDSTGTMQVLMENNKSGE